MQESAKEDEAQTTTLRMAGHELGDGHAAPARQGCRGGSRSRRGGVPPARCSWRSAPYRDRSRGRAGLAASIDLALVLGQGVTWCTTRRPSSAGRCRAWPARWRGRGPRAGAAAAGRRPFPPARRRRPGTAAGPRISAFLVSHCLPPPDGGRAPNSRGIPPSGSLWGSSLRSRVGGFMSLGNL